MSVTSISEKTKLLLWWKSAGRCEYIGCNKALYRDDVTQAEFNQAYIAHIVADSPNGPRWDAVLSPQLSDDISNLMTLCDSHHRLIDKVDVEWHPVDRLLAMKQEHEGRIEIVTGIDHSKKSHVVVYRANVWEHTPVITAETANNYLLPDRYPASPSVINLGMGNSVQRDRNELFWHTEENNLIVQFQQQLSPKLRTDQIQHISIFAFAPMPLLIKLGVLLSDIRKVDIHQPVRDPSTWNLSDTWESTLYKVITPVVPGKMVALNISLSATVTNDRITQVLWDECAIYTLTIDAPFNDFLKNKQQLRDFSETMRRLFDQIKATYGATTPLHIFPAMPIAISVELGRIWMPKADMPLHIYDENTSRGGFKKVLEINNQ